MAHGGEERADEEGDGMKVNVKRFREQKAAEVVEEQRDKIITFCIALGCHACRRMRNFGRKRLDLLVRGAYLQIMEWYEHYGGEIEKGLVIDEVPTLYYGLRNQVKCLDVPVEELEKRSDFSPDFREWRNANDRAARRARWDELTRMEKVTRSYWYAMMLHLRETYGWGAQCLTRFYEYVQNNYAVIMSYYLLCRPDEDEKVYLTWKQTPETIKELGVSL